MTDPYTISQLNEGALIVSFGNVINVEVNEKIITLHDLLMSNSFEGFIESVPAYSSVAVFYSGLVSFTSVSKHVEEVIEAARQHGKSQERIIEIPVLYDGEDLQLVALQHQLQENEVIKIHTSKIYRVFMLGFLPGFPYMGTVDEQIATPRKSSPRTAVPAGSVGIAGRQTGIYPQSSPGGWQLIGRTPKKIFDSAKLSPCLFSPGDAVRFYPISKSEFENSDEY